MMPEAAAVIAAARRMVEGGPEDIQSWDAMANTLDTLDAKLASIGTEPTKEEQDRTWGEVVAGDEILSAKTKKWYEVHTSVRTPEGKMKIMIKKAPQPIVRPASDPVRVRRGVDGEAVDILEVLFSGQTRPTMTQGGGDIGPMLTDKVEDDDE